jgi:ribosomal protein S18 acetylase RimI-like enzyme
VIGSVIAGYDRHRGWLYALAVWQDCMRRSVGTELVRTAAAALHRLACGKMHLQVRGTNAAVAGFYQRLGSGGEDRVSMGGLL